MSAFNPPGLLFPEVEIPELKLPTEDGVPLETNWHRIEINLLIDSVHQHWRDRRDYFAGGNMFLYFSLDQVRNRDYRGPDFFLVKNVDGARKREAWIVWAEKGRYPDLIIELASPTTIEIDLGLKKQLYEQTFHTPDYFCYDPNTLHLAGWRWVDGGYVELEADERGWLWSKEMNSWLGLWEGEYQKVNDTWLRFYTPEGQLVLTKGEAEAQRAEAAEAETTRLRALLAKHNIPIGEEPADETTTD
jgi:Uma2 family endonuclease